MQQMHMEKMELPRRLLFLIVPLLCFGHFSLLTTCVNGRSTFEANPVDSASSSSTSSQSPYSETNPLDIGPSSLASSQTPYTNPTSARTTYPRTPVRSSATTVPTAVPSSNPFEVSPPQSPIYTPLKTTPPRWPELVPTSEIPATQRTVAASETTLPLDLRKSAVQSSNLPLTVVPTPAPTSLSVNSPPSSAPQRCQLTFANKYNDLKGTDYDLWAHRTNAQRQLADFCRITTDRITNIAIEPSPSGNLVLRFSIEQGWPVYTAEALQNLKNRLGTTSLQLASEPLTSPVAVYWTDNGSCPNETCLNNGICDVTLANEYKCSCDDEYTGVRCQDDVRARPVSTAPHNNALFALLVLLVIPVAIAVVVGFIFGRRKQQKQQLKKAFDLRDVRTIGPRSMLSLPMESGIRNQMYDTRSFAVAFSDTTFSKSVPSSTNDDSASNAVF